MNGMDEWQRMQNEKIALMSTVEDMVSKLTHENERLLHDNSAMIAQHSNMCQEIERLRKALQDLYLFCQDLNDFRPDSRLGREVREALGLVGHQDTVP